MQSVALALFAAAFMCSFPAQAQTGDPGQPITERAFIANGGGDFGDNADDAVHDSDRAYGVFFVDMKQWGRYEIVSTPARADWIFKINAGNSPSCVKVFTGGEGCHKYPETSDCSYLKTVNDFRIEVVMMDARTMGIRRRFVEHLKGGSLFTSAETRLDRAVAALVDDLKEAVGERGTPTPVGHLDVPGPVPPQIGSAKKVYLNDISQSDDRSDKFTAGGARVLQVVTRTFKDWGRFELVPNPAEADLLVEVSFFVRPVCYGYPGDPTLRVFIRDPKNEVLLWGLTKHVEAPILGRNKRKNFDSGAIDLVRNELRALVATPTWTAGASISAKPVASSSHAAIPLASSSGREEESSAALVPATISAQKSVVKSGAQVRIAVAVKNSSKQDLDFGFPEGDPLTCLIAVRNDDGKLVSATEHGRVLQVAHASSRGRRLEYSLHPGETQRRECPVSEIYDMSQAGKYFIQLVEVDGRSAQSNTLVLTVLP
jgi:hypothetical protein